MRNGLRSLYVNGNSLVFSSVQIDAAFQDDVLTCTLYCQLAASAKYSAFNDVVNWRQRYVSAMTSFGCPVVYRDVQSLPLEPDDVIWTRLKDMLGKRVPHSLLETVEPVIARLAANVDDDAISRLRKQTAKPGSEAGLVLPTLANARPQIGELVNTAEQSKQIHDVTLQLGFIAAEPTVSLVLLSFKSAKPISELPLAELFCPSTIIGNLEVAIFGVELDEHQFALTKPALLEKLGSRRAELCMEIDGVEP